MLWPAPAQFTLSEESGRFPRKEAKLKLMIFLPINEETVDNYSFILEESITLRARNEGRVLVKLVEKVSGYSQERER